MELKQEVLWGKDMDLDMDLDMKIFTRTVLIKEKLNRFKCIKHLLTAGSLNFRRSFIYDVFLVQAFNLLQKTICMQAKRILFIGGNYYPEPTGIGKYNG